MQWVGIVTSWNGGSSTLIDGKDTWLIVKKFDVDKWRKEDRYLDDEKYALEVTQSAKELIINEFTWDVLARKMIFSIKGESV